MVLIIVNASRGFHVGDAGNEVDADGSLRENRFIHGVLFQTWKGSHCMRHAFVQFFAELI